MVAIVDDGLHDDRVAGVDDQIRKSLVLVRLTFQIAVVVISRITENAESVSPPSSLKTSTLYHCLRDSQSGVSPTGSCQGPPRSLSPCRAAVLSLFRIGKNTDNPWAHQAGQYEGFRRPLGHTGLCSDENRLASRKVEQVTPRGGACKPSTNSPEQ